MSNIIQLLPDYVANQIAAGEVVQRPSSVVKELIENSIDAGATKITLLLKDAGKTLIQVIDNGKGMSKTDARMCFERHATSKINNADDLFNLHTKGFRGEALASISGVSHVILKTKQKLNDLGTIIKIEGSKIISQEVIYTPTGTSIAVKNLFFNIPARRKFLKSDNVETRHIIDEFQRISLAHPTISFILHHNNNEIYNLKENNLRKRIVSIFGAKMDEKLVPISEKTDILEIKGFFTKPKFAKKKRGEQFFFVNDRYVKNAYLNHAVISAFEGLLEQNTYPSYFLYLKVPPNSIDINIHPSKTEIKFDNEKSLYAILIATIKHSLGQFNIAPLLDFNRDSSLDTPYEFKDKSVISTPKIIVNPTFNPFKKNTNINEPVSRCKKNKQINYNSKKNDWESLYTNIEFDDQPKQEQLFNENKYKTVKTFQLQKKYLLSSIKSGAVIINQTLAHQRILYEYFLEKITVKEINSQQLLFPIKISFSSSDIQLINNIKDDLQSTGFVFKEITQENIIIEGIPTSISESQIIGIIEQLIDDLKMEVPNNSFSHFDIMAKSFAKSLAIKTGTILNTNEQENLVNDLFSCKEPSITPFGKSTFKTLTLQEIDKIFNT